MAFMSSTDQGTASSATTGATQSLATAGAEKGSLNTGNLQTILSGLQTSPSASQTLLPTTANDQATFGDATSHNVHGSLMPYVDNQGAIMSMGHG